MKTSSRAANVITGVAAVCLLAALASAARVKISSNDAGPFPDVDDAGNIDCTTPVPGFVQLVVNTTSGKFRAKGNAQVENASGKKQVYKNDPDAEMCLNLVDDPPDLVVDKSIYKVGKTGKATVKANGVIDPGLLM